MPFRKLLIFTSFLLSSCGGDEPPIPEPTPPVVEVPETPARFSNTATTKAFPYHLLEISGISSSISIPNAIWAQQDSNSPTEIYLLSTIDGGLIKTVSVKGVENTDWEDISITKNGPKSDVSYGYLADIGDNLALRSSVSIYRFEEPTSVSVNQILPENIHFRYPDGSKNAEAFLVEPTSKDIYIFSKEESKSRVYKLPYPQNTESIQTAQYVGELPFGYIVSADISSDGREILFKSYLSIYYWKRKTSEDLFKTMQATFRILPYTIEPQGEAVSWDKNGKGYYTCSEGYQAPPSLLYFYARTN